MSLKMDQLDNSGAEFPQEGLELKSSREF